MSNKHTDVKKVIREWAKERGGAALMRLPGTAIHAKPETVRQIIQEARDTGRPVGALVRDRVELVQRIRDEIARGGPAAAALRRILEEPAD